MDKIKKIGKWLCNLPSRLYRWLRAFVMSKVLGIKRLQAISLHKSTGATLYVVAVSCLDVRILNKQQYNFCKKWLLKNRGKDIREITMYRIDVTGVHAVKMDGFNLKKKGRG